jgi:hypothetical protein
MNAAALSLAVWKFAIDNRLAEASVQLILTVIAEPKYPDSQLR